MDRREVLALGLAAAGAGLRPAPAKAAGTAETDAGNAPREDANLTIGVETLREAEKLHAVRFPDDALRRLAPLLSDKAKAIGPFHAESRPRDLQPASRFDPRMPGRTYPVQHDHVRLHAGRRPTLPRADIDVAFASVAEQAHWLATRQISSLRLTEIYLDRIPRIDPKLNAFITITADLARRQAKERDAELAAGRSRGPLHGIPYTLKDVIDTAGIPTTWGSSLFRQRVPSEDSAVAAKLREAGGVLLGKVATAELANGATWFGGMVRNPWNIDEPSGGSSAGSGSSVAAGLCAFSIGTDSLGSILNPADRCGVTGLRPTFGRVPVHGCMPLTPSLERIGPLCRRAEDAALVLAAINGPDPRSSASIDFGFAYDSAIDPRTIKVGYSPKWFSKVGFGEAGGEGQLLGLVPASPGHLNGLAAMKDIGVEMVEVEFPVLPYAMLLDSLYVESAAIFEDLTLSGKDAQLIAPWADSWRQARFLSAVDYYQIERFRRQVMEMMDRLFDRVDILFAPTYGSFELLMIANFTGHPGLSFRSGFAETATRDLGFAPIDPSGAKRRVTSNISMHGRLFEEGKMLALARLLEEKLDVWRERPTIG
ncbi:amidase [Sphingosinicella rhizophila]|uniref:Amidase n=1 Tax=Sphingosinicella rhizophila TaxID=3050082 RepID=A0ABU3QCK4_9SPHN|nr:amidase [Sphingosinicella sp. GR2756]MDT9601022.1 amidase [Sphingosinicella sp. GR2756]